jgi:hypothetical protein
VRYEISQFNAEDLASTEADIIAAGRDDHGASVFGFAYDAALDRIVVSGQITETLQRALQQLLGVNVNVITDSEAARQTRPTT